MLLKPLSRLHLVLWLALLAPLAGFAQDPEEEASAPPLVPATEAPAAPDPRGEVFPREQPAEDLESLYLVPRLTLQPPAGFVLGGVMGIAGGIPIFLIALPFCKGSISDGLPEGPCTEIVNAGIATSAAFGAAVGVSTVGRLLHGRGRFWHTALGALLGTAAAYSSALAADLKNPFFATTVLAGSALGATVSYAISELYAPEPRHPAPQAGTSAAILPVVSATRTGGLVAGLVGRF